MSRFQLVLISLLLFCTCTMISCDENKSIKCHECATEHGGCGLMKHTVTCEYCARFTEANGNILMGCAEDYIPIFVKVIRANIKAAGGRMEICKNADYCNTAHRMAIGSSLILVGLLAGIYVF
ncbi:hypothetical protein M3Y98_00022500 [Aphelenchoides besseyi]|nr:hypothetical protein M3Y98_00022500 [Aphelenchoides besseyi]KAI6199265.1 hypothetical protein M3Y96_00608500 [Aphelenchoides besseyi]